ncbi:hypothetical protein PFICI_02291 [Pestalotiopsis fici W106-1]|uniref:Uncharacterized protein n=1 Tax=Pestalotiopsis fici (strain W106-1 / CGMCC3.15140) TaxID=1229662 RepID=W3XGF0_PESFW|nr:uncharacterized protein PFICI_02291 [Pestalotiopsis fici W106-1]ETS84266.1 hypothetical protein PFICI_02291 [Pestalotiopsis fici W106-1]
MFRCRDSGEAFPGSLLYNVGASACFPMTPHEPRLYDDFNDVTLPATIDRPEAVSTRTTWTLLLYLTSAAEGCLGGQTVFYPHDRKVGKEAIEVELETGMLLLHKHGDDCLLCDLYCKTIEAPLSYTVDLAQCQAPEAL